MSTGSVAVAEFAGVIDLGRDAGQVFHQIFADHAGVKRGAAADEDDPVGLAQFRRRQVQAAEARRRFLVVDASAQGVLDGVRLLENFLEHEVREFPALDFLGGELDLADLRADGQGLNRRDLKIVAGERDNFEIVEVDHAAGVRDDGANVAGQEILVASHAQQQGTAPARADDHVGMIGLDDGDAVGADDVFERTADGLGQSRAVLAGIFGADLVVVVADEMGEHFGVRLRDKGVAFGDEAFLEELVVFDDAVVDEGNFAGLVQVRVRVLVGGRTVRGPARVADTGGALGGLLADERGQIVDAAGLLAQVEFAVVQDAEPGGIVPAIFQTTQAFENDAGGGLGANVANDATHICFT